MHNVAVRRFLAAVAAGAFIGLAGAQDLQLTTDPAPDYHPKWSPDGQSILFTSQRGGHIGIWQVDLAGG